MKFVKTIWVVFIAVVVIAGLTFPAWAGSTTSWGYFYKPAYGEKGATGYNSYNAALDATDLVIHNLATGGATLPSQTGNNGKFLTTNGTTPSWATVSGSGDVTGGSASAAGELAGYTSTTGKAITRTYLKFTGLATTVRTMTVPDADFTVVYQAGLKTPVAAALPSGSTPSLAAADAYTDSQTSDLTSPAIVAAVGTRRIIFFTAIRAVRFDTSTTLKGNNSASWTTAVGAWMELNSDGTYWRCAIHGAD